jgi:hypothetical protein
MPIYAIHPADKDLNFLKRINEELRIKLAVEYKYLRLEANNQSHEFCINTLTKDKNSSVFFFCHALEKSIRGCKIESRFSSLSHKDYNYGPLISPSLNIKIFEGKKVFCLACNSSDLGKYAIGAGAKVFLGFGDIPFYLRENFKESIIEAGVKRELSLILFESLQLFVFKHWSFNQLSSYLQLLINKRRSALLNDKSNGVNIRKEISNVLSRVKNGIAMFGNGELKIKD